MLSANQLQQAKITLGSGGIIAYPTESVFGLGCDPLNRIAVEQLLALKKRQQSKGLILIASHVQQVLPFINPHNGAELARALKTWPGHHTWIFRKSQWVPQWISGDFDTVAVRVSKHPVVVQLLNHINKPIVSTSANISNNATLTSVKEIKSVFGDKIQYYCDLPTGFEASPSTIHDAFSNTIIR